MNATAGPTPVTNTAAPRQSMRAVVHTEYGTADVLHVDRVDRPTIDDDEVLVRVHAAGLDRGAWHFLAGQPYAMRLASGLRRPRNPVLGREIAGTVVAVGAKVARFAAGDDVFGVGEGSFAEYASARVDKLARKPASLTFAQAAATGISGPTALRAVREVGHVQPGQHVLVVGASGGVGTFAVQLAKAFGATVTGVCGPTKVDLVRSLGADHVVDYTRDDFADGSRRYDLILDVGGSSPLSRLRRALGPRGTLVIVGGEDGGRWLGMRRQLRAMALSPFVRQRLAVQFPKEDHAELEQLAELAEAGRLTPAVDRTYPLHEAADAMRHLDAGHARGKLVIVV